MKRRHLPYRSLLLLMSILAIFALPGCDQDKNKTAEDSHVIVTGEIQPASEKKLPSRCQTHLNGTSTGHHECGVTKTIELTFHRTTPNISKLTVTTDLANLSAIEPGWTVHQNALTCNDANISREQCSLKLTYTPTHNRPEGAVYVDYEYYIIGHKSPKKDRISVIYPI